LKIKLRMRRPGFYPRGGGAVEAHFSPCLKLAALQLMNRSDLHWVKGISAVASLPATIAERQTHRALNQLKECGLRVNIREESWIGGPGTVVALTLDTKPVPTLFFALGARGKRAERVADEAAEQVQAYLEAAPAAVDPHSADQLVLPLSLADGPSTFTTTAITPHLLTNVAVIRRFVEREISCEGELGRPGVVQIR
jgi:RNA 3'-phosphate cyclase